MEIPESVQEILRCVDCGELLSCGPVFLVHETSEAICGRCSPQPQEEEEEEQQQQEEDEDAASKSGTQGQNRSRNVQYEAAAKLLSFPCRFAAEGCTNKMDFSDDEPSAHERNCEFRTFICPIEMTRGSCEWVGSTHKLIQHCRDVHPTYFFQNPFVLPRPDLTKSNSTNFLVSAFNLLFLMHVKVCTLSGKLFHSMRMFGDSELLDEFSYLLKIEGNDSEVKKKGSVLRAGIMTIQEPSANFVLINSLLDLLSGKYDDSKFTISIESLLKFNCLNCSKLIDNVSNLEFCKECEGKLVKCEFNENGCLFVDVDKKKCEKHAAYFCEKRTKCCFCKVNSNGGSFLEHFGSSSSCLKAIKSKIDSVVRVTKTAILYFILFPSNNIGTILCYYNLSNSNFYLYLHTSLPSHELKNFKCSIELTDPQTKHSLLLTPQIQYNILWDWSIYEKMDNFPSWQNIGIDIKINVDKI